MTTSLVAFIDSDCAADPGWITQLAAHFADPLVGAVAPRVRPMTGRSAVGRYLDARAPIDMGGSEARVAPLTRLAYVPTAALLVRRAAAGTGFDPDLRYGEDVDLIWRMIAAGWRVRYDPAAEVLHAEPGRWRRVLARRFRYGRSAAPLARRHPGLVPPLVLQAWPAAVVAGAAGPAARHRARRLRRRDRPAGPAAARLGHPRPGRAGADGRVRAAHLARRWPVERPVRAPGGRRRPRLAR